MCVCFIIAINRIHNSQQASNICVSAGNKVTPYSDFSSSRSDINILNIMRACIKKYTKVSYNKILHYDSNILINHTALYLVCNLLTLLLVPFMSYTPHMTIKSDSYCHRLWQTRTPRQGSIIGGWDNESIKLRVWNVEVMATVLVRDLHKVGHRHSGSCALI